ncbi:MAG: T9SS type A sorting domain-containing protein [Flavobacteriales bacterium]|nr:T9SS type A sorting domain-containing protein [Flavobacteriales bacterium]
MKKLIRTLIVLIFSPIIILAQPDWQWGQEVRVNARDIAVDHLGNSYVTWSLQNSYTLEGEVFVSNGPSDAALTSFDCDGNHRWTKIIGGSSGDVPWGLGTDTLGGVYVAVNANGARLQDYDIDMDADTTLSAGQRALLLVKYNTEGELQWSRLPEDSVIFNLPDDLQIGAAIGLDVAPNGDSYVYSRLFPGTYGNGAFEATFEATLQGGEDIYALTYNSEGICTGGVHFDIWYDGGLLAKSEIIRDHYTGRFYLSGYLNTDNDVFIFGGEQVTAENYVVQFDNEGEVDWVVSMDDIGIYDSQFIGKPSADEFGNVYVTGNSGSVAFATNASTSSGNTGKTTAYTNNKVVVAGHWGSQLIWGDIEEDDTDEGSQGFDAFLAIFDAAGNGEPESFHSLNSSPLGSESPNVMTADQQGNFYVGGQFSGQIYTSTDTIYNQTGDNEGFIVKFGTDSCYCPLPEALFTYDSIPDEAGYTFNYSGTQDVDSVTWDFGDGQTGSGLEVQHTYIDSGEYTICATAYNACGTDSTCTTFETQGTVGVKTIAGFKPIQVYPNPTRNTLTVVHDTPGIRVSVRNALGQEVQTAILNATRAQIDVGQLPPGLYLLQLTDGNKKVGYARFVKE